MSVFDGDPPGVDPVVVVVDRLVEIWYSPNGTQQVRVTSAMLMLQVSTKVCVLRTVQCACI